MSENRSQTPNDRPGHDVIVVGAGLAGLTAAIALQQRGRQVLLLERRNAVGGLCGTTVVDGYEFTLGCNDFGSSILRVMEELGVRVQFRPSRTIIHCERETYTLPMNPGTILNLVRHAPDVLRLVRALRNPAVEDTYGYLEPLLDKCVRSAALADILSVTSYGYGLIPSYYRIDLFKQLFTKKQEYGHGKFVTPVGGPRAIADAMAARFIQLGGQLELGAEVIDIRDTADGKLVVTADNAYQARAVVSSEGRVKDYPRDAKAGLAVGVLYLATRPDIPYPDDVHTVAYLPPGVARWLNRLDAGDLPEQFGFHIFPSDTTTLRDYRLFNVYFYCPRGMDEFDRPTAERIQGYVLDHLERIVPGLATGVIFQQLVSPARFLEENDLSSRAVQAVTLLGADKPPVYDAEQDIYYVGNTVGPPGSHVGAAMHSGLQAAKALFTASCRGPTGRIPHEPRRAESA
jgi:phytoene dehydrogenase-like protein